MQIDWSSFTPWSAVAGGILIGISAGLFILVNGRIAGISGVLGGLLRPSTGDVAWRIAFLAGLIAAPATYGLFLHLPRIAVDAGYPSLVVAGLLVGMGTRYGSGCTSGHGVCGIARRSPRSLTATLVFMAMGFLTVYLIRHLLAGGW